MTDVTITVLPAAPLHALEIWSNPAAVATRFKKAAGFALPAMGRSDGNDALRLIRYEPTVWLVEGDVSTLSGILADDGALTAIGGSIGRTMDETDRRNTVAALENVRTGVPSSWVNPDTGYEYVVTPTQTYEAETGPCREYTLDAEIGGKTEQIYGTACRQADGSWVVVD